LPTIGSRAAVEGDASLLMIACITCCWRWPRVMSVSLGSSRFSRTRE
jgi:hypothetical protein